METFSLRGASLETFSLCGASLETFSVCGAGRFFLCAALLWRLFLCAALCGGHPLSDAGHHYFLNPIPTPFPIPVKELWDSFVRALLLLYPCGQVPLDILRQTKFTVKLFDRQISVKYLVPSQARKCSLRKLSANAWIHNTLRGYPFRA